MNILAKKKPLFLHVCAVTNILCNYVLIVACRNLTPGEFSPVFIATIANSRLVKVLSMFPIRKRIFFSY